jgi:hypothetical protein
MTNEEVSELRRQLEGFRCAAADRYKESQSVYDWGIMEGLAEAIAIVNTHVLLASTRRKNEPEVLKSGK